MREKKDPTKVVEKRSKILSSRSKERKFLKSFKNGEFGKVFILYFIFHIFYYNTQHIKQKGFQYKSLSIRDHKLIKVVQASHHQDDVRYGAYVLLYVA